MKKYIYYFMSLIVTLLVSTTAKAEVGDVVTSLDQLGQSKCYTISTSRGKVVLNTSKTGVVSSHQNDGSVVNSNASTNADDGKWVILVADGHYYLYNVSKSQFLSTTNRFSAVPTALSIESASSPSGDYQYVVKGGAGLVLYNNNLGVVGFSSSATADDGVRVCLQEAGEFDQSLLVAKYSSLLGNVLTTAKGALADYKTSTQDGDYYAGTDAGHGLKSHYFVDGTEKTSQKGLECTQTQIDALSSAISGAEAILARTDVATGALVAAYEQLLAAKSACDKKWDPLVDGVYFIVNGFADDAPTAAQALKYGENGEILYKRPLITSEPKQMFEVKVISWDTDTDGDKIPTSAYIKNIASGKYLGGVSNGHNVFSDSPIAISWPEANTQGTTKQGHRFQLQTPTGELFNGQNSQSGCEVLTSGLYQWHRSWMFRPADKYYQEYLANKEYNDFKNSVLAALAVPTAKEDGDLGSNSWIDGTERTALAGVETTQERLDSLQSAWNAYEADRSAANKAAVEAAMAQVNKKWEPLSDGVYFLIPRFGDDQINNNTQAMTFSGNAAWKKPLVKSSPEFMFEVTVKSTKNDPTLGEVPMTITIKNVSTGKYLGAINGSAWEYQDNEAVWSYTTFVGNDFFSPAKHAHCFGLNIGGKFITYANNTAGSALTTTTGGWAWYRAWMFRPADKYYQEYINNKEEADKKNILEPALASINSAITPANHHDNTGTRSFLLGDEKTSVDGLATSKEAIDSLKSAYNIVDEGFKSGKTVADLTSEIEALRAAKAVVDAKSNPLTDGYYYIISEYADDTNDIPGGYAIQYGSNVSNPNYAYKQPYKKGLADQIFYVEYDKASNKVYLKNVGSNLYLGKVGENGHWEFVNEKTALNIVSGTDYYWYWSASKTAAARSCSFIITNDEQTGLKSSTRSSDQLTTVASVTTKSQAWDLAWAFRPAEYTQQDEHGWAMQYTPIKTPYADTVKPDSVLQEYPRPQMVRENNWVNLNGLWSFKNLESFDQELPEVGYKDILVPFCVESAMSGIKRHYDNMVYRRTVAIPANWTGKRILLNFGAVDWKSQVEVNGNVVGDHEGGYDPFTLDITDYVEAGQDAKIIVRVYDPTDTKSIPRGKQVGTPGGIFYTACSGIWQTVWMEAVNNTYIKDFTITPDVDASSVKVLVEGSSSESIPVKVTILREGTAIAEQAGTTGDTLSIAIANPELWSPNHPFLYDVKLELLEGNNPVDEVKSYFGMRKINIQKDKDGFVRTMLNNQFVFQMGPLDQGYWPESNLTPPSDEAIQNDLRVIKNMGFNMVRKHIKVEPARWYYWADKMGLLVWQDMPSMNYGGVGGIGNDATIFTKELTAMVRNLKNVPSIVTWVVFNEGGGQHNTRQYVNLVRSLDNSRLINEASGWTHYGYGDIKDIHPYPAPSYTTSSTQATACGEYGGVKYAIDGHLWSGSGWGYASVADATEYDDTYTEYANKLAIYKNTKGLSAAVYTQLTDVEIEVNGLMTYDRVIKSDVSRILKANRIIIEGEGTERNYILSTADVNPETWKYTTSQPSQNWKDADFDDSSWSTGKAGFGKGVTNSNTTWGSSDIWLRKTVSFDINADQLENLRGRIFNDEDVEVYINGILAYSATGYLTTYKNITFNEDAVRSINLYGDNQVAIHVKQTSGGQYIDLGMYLNEGAKEEPVTREMLINMEYSNSSAVSVRIGYSRDLEATEPEVWYDYTRLPIDKAIVGLEEDLICQPTDLRYNITNLTKDLDPETAVKYFVYVNTTASQGEGWANACKLIDYTNNPEGDVTNLMGEIKQLNPSTSVLLTAVIKPTGIDNDDVIDANQDNKVVNVYSVDGKIVKSNVNAADAIKGVDNGLYIIDKKVYKK